jgi:hypothetical protein
MLCKRCRPGHKEDNKIGFAFLGFSCEFTCILQDTGPIHKGNKNLLMGQLLERFETSQKSPRHSQPCPYGGGAGPEGANK